MFRALCAHHQDVKIVLYSIWYHRTCRWPSRAQVERRFSQPVQVWWQQAVSKPVWHIPLLCVQWKTPDDGQKNCPKHVEFYSKNKFEKLVHLVVGFIVRMYHDARSPERQNIFFKYLKHNADVPLENKKKGVPKFIRNYVYLLQPQSPVAMLTTLPEVTQCNHRTEICSSRKFYSLTLPTIDVPFPFFFLLWAPLHEL